MRARLRSCALQCVCARACKCAAGVVGSVGSGRGRQGTVYLLSPPLIALGLSFVWSIEEEEEEEEETRGEGFCPKTRTDAA